MQLYNHKAKTNRINWIDYTKFIGIYFVILGHTVNVYLGSDLLIWIYSFHMPLFFFISGFFIKENDSIKQTLVKGFKTLIVPYISFYLLTLFVELVLLYYFTPNFFEISFSDRLLKYIFGLFIAEGHNTQYSINHNHYLWFLVGLFFCKIIVQGVFERKNIYRNLIIMAVASIFITYILVQTRFEIYWSIDSAIMGIPFYILGYFFYKYDKQKEYSVPINVVLGISLLFLNIMLSYIYRNDTIRVDMAVMSYGNNILLFYLNAIIGSLAIIFIVKSFSKKENRLCLYIGSNTLIILCTHRYGIIFIKDILLEKIIKNKFSFYFNYFHIEDIIISFCVLLVLLIPLYIIKNYFPIIMGEQQINKSINL